LTIFFVPFSSTALIIVEGRTVEHWLPAVNYFGLLWMLSESPRLLRDGVIALPPRRPTSIVLLFAFTSVALLSLIVPMVISGSVTVPTFDFATGRTERAVEFSLHYLLVWFDLAFGTILAVMIGRRNSEPSELQATIRILVASVVFVSCWGILEYASYRAGASFPQWIFNTNPGASTGGSILRNLGIKRITSVALEPAVFIEILLAGLPFLLVILWGGGFIYSTRIDRTGLVLVLLCLLLAGSSSGYVGLAVALFSTVVALWYLEHLFVKPLAWAGAISAMLAVSYITVPSVRAFAEAQLVGKLATESGLERLYFTLVAWETFRMYPLLGLGWGSVASYDLVVKLLATTGVIGLSVFLLLIASVLRRILGSLRAARLAQGDPALRLWGTAILVALVTQLAVSAINGWNYELAHFWLLLGLAISIPSALQHSRFSVENAQVG
jgi:hypothetical protein